MNESAQYATPDNLCARISLHRYARHPDWTSWLFERELPPAGAPARILDLGCGPGTLWLTNRERIDPGWEITLADASAGMLAAARGELGDAVAYVVADAQALPFPDGAFDVVLANHMLYHVADRPRALAEIRRVLVPGGSLRCSTSGRGHMRELVALRPEMGAVDAFVEAFGLETGPAQLEAFFTDVAVERFDNALAVPAAEPVVAYIRSAASWEAHADLSDAAATVAAEIERTGCFTISTRPGLITAAAPAAGG